MDSSSPHGSGSALPALATLAEAAARAGGAVARRHFRTGLEVRLKADRSEVTIADEAAQQAVIATIRAARPADAFIAEERLQLDPPAPPPAPERLCWIIDPIDGTRNYIRHIPLYACSVAVMQGGVPLAGTIYDPERDVLYSAVRGGPLCIDAAPAPPRGRRNLNHKLVVGLPSSPGPESAALAHAWLDRFVCRSLGSTALHLALVASGELDAMLGDNPRLWDLAAGCLLVEAAGGVTATIEGRPVFPVDVAAYRGEPIVTLAAGGPATLAQVRATQ